MSQNSLFPKVKNYSSFEVDHNFQTPLDVCEYMVDMVPVFTSKSAHIVNAPHGAESKGMKLGYYILLECMKMSDSVIALMPWFTLAYKKYTGEELEGAHDAMNDVFASFKVLQGMVSEGHVPTKLEELLKFQMNGQEFDSTVDFAGKFIRNQKGVILLNFGKHRGEPAADHPDFLSWMLGKDFTSDTLLWAQAILKQQ